MEETVLTDAEMVVLSLIYERPKHGYQVEQEIAERNMGAWTEISTSSIYYVLRRLDEKGLIEKSTEGEQKGVPRKVYAITEEGKRVWKEATLEALSRPKITYTNFLMGLHNLWDIAPEEALPAVKVYRDWLDADLQRQREELQKFEISFFPLDVLFEYGFVLGDAELAFLDDLIGRLAKMAGES